MRVCLHWRPAHVDDCQLSALHKILRAHPGPDEVRVVLNHTRVRLPIRVDSTVDGLADELHAATGAFVHIVDLTAAAL